MWYIVFHNPINDYSIIACLILNIPWIFLRYNKNSSITIRSLLSYIIHFLASFIPIVNSLMVIIAVSMALSSIAVNFFIWCKYSTFLDKEIFRKK